MKVPLASQSGDMDHSSTPARRSSIAAVLGYHALSKHHPRRFAPGPGGLDWANQPDPFRRFAGAPVTPLPLTEALSPCAYDRLYAPASPDPIGLSPDSLGLFLELGLGLSAWKEFGTSRWALRNNPSSGNLHPTEGYVLLPAPLSPALDAGVHHYAPHAHALERRVGLEPADAQVLARRLGRDRFLAALSSIHWREAWKYGERAFRYCQHDAGHAFAALRFAARVLGWSLRVAAEPADGEIAALFGLDRAADFADAEPEHPDCIFVVDVAGRDLHGFCLSLDLAHTLSGATWSGRANRLSREHVPWPAIAAVSGATEKPRLEDALPWEVPEPPPAQPELATLPPAEAVAIIRRRRSAVAMDGETGLSKAAFLRVLSRTMPRRDRPPWDAFPYAPAVLLAVFVHRVASLDPGLYLLARNPARLAEFRAACRADHLAWSGVDGTSLPLYALMPGADLRDAAATISCTQDIAGDGAFSLGMIADLGRTLQTEGPWAYRRLYWETGIVGQVLYLEAEALGVRGTGIGCFFDDLLHALLGLDPEGGWQDLYHFTVGGPIEDPRLRTSPAYAHLDRRR